MTDPADCEHGTVAEKTLATEDPLIAPFKWLACPDCGAVVPDSLGGDGR